MTNTKFILAFLSFITLSMTTAFAQTGTKVNEKTTALLKQCRMDYGRAMIEKKPELIQSYYSEYVRLMPAFQKTVIGKSNALLYHKAFNNRFVINDFKREEMEVLDLGTQVLELGKLTLRITQKSNSRQQELIGTYLNIWEELDNKELSLITEAWNYNSYYGEIHALLKFEEVPSIHAALLPNVNVTDNISFELAALNRLLDATVTQHDGSVWSQYYTKDAILIPGYHPPRNGRKEIDEYIAMHVKELPVFEALEIRNDRIDNLGSYIIEYASHIASWRNGNASGVGMGKNIRIWRREQDHSLKLFRSMAMYD